MSMSARSVIRAEVIDNMTHEERRALLAKLEKSVNDGFTPGEDELDEWVAEVLAGRPTDEEDEDWG
jgi:hypothetical protein